MDPPLDTRLSIGLQTIHRRSEPAAGPWRPRIDDLVDHPSEGRLSCVVTPDMYRAGLAKIAAAAAEAGRRPTRFGTGHLLCSRDLAADRRSAPPGMIKSNKAIVFCLS
jgi:hypothetical protein